MLGEVLQSEFFKFPYENIEIYCYFAYSIGQKGKNLTLRKNKRNKKKYYLKYLDNHKIKTELKTYQLNWHRRQSY